MRIFGQNGLVDVCTSKEQLDRYIRAPNADVVRSQDGRIQAVRLWSVGDDRGHAGERHGSSTVTTQRIRNEAGKIIAPDYAVEHKPVGFEPTQ